MALHEKHSVNSYCKPACGIRAEYLVMVFTENSEKQTQSNFESEPIMIDDASENIK